MKKLIYQLKVMSLEVIIFSILTLFPAFLIVSLVRWVL